MSLKLYFISILIFSSIKTFSQSKPKDVEDVTSIENIVEAALQSISGAKGEERDWGRFRNLFLPTAQLNGVFHKEDSSWIKINSLEDFIDMAGTWYEDNGFYEFSLHNKVDRFGNIAHVFQTYGAKYQGGEEKGINSFQLVKDKGRWWIVNLLWESETSKTKIPEEYLK